MVENDDYEHNDHYNYDFYYYYNIIPTITVTIVL